MKDPFEILADEITLIRRQMDHLQRTSLNREEAEDLNARVVQAVADMQKTGTTVQRVLQHDLAKAALDVRAHAVEAAKGAAREAIETSHAESLRAARSLSEAAGEARRQAWRYFGGFWVWLASVGTAGALLGALAMFWLQGRGDAKAFGDYPGIYCTTAGGQVVTNRDGSSYCGFWIEKPDRTE